MVTWCHWNHISAECRLIFVSQAHMKTATHTQTQMHTHITMTHKQVGLLGYIRLDIIALYFTFILKWYPVIYLPNLQDRLCYADTEPNNHAGGLYVTTVHASDTEWTHARLGCRDSTTQTNTHSTHDTVQGQAKVEATTQEVPHLEP